MVKKGKLFVFGKSDGPTPRSRSARLSVGLRLGVGSRNPRLSEPEAEFSNFLIRQGVVVLRLGLGEPLCLSAALLRLSVLANPVLFSPFR